jgi:hypothetical protein
LGPALGRALGPALGRALGFAFLAAEAVFLAMGFFAIESFLLADRTFY